MPSRSSRKQVKEEPPSPLEIRRSTALKEFQDVVGESHTEPYVTGTLALPLSDFDLFYHAGGQATSINLAQASSEQLQALADICAQATFGCGSEDVLDESYRKAGKLDAEQFSTRIVPERTSLLDTLRGHLLDGLSSSRPIKFELYNLNVYGEGSFFKPHVDTPRSKSMFGSLVLVFPTPHEGGNLVLRHKDHELNFDSASAARDQSSPSIAFAAFFSDVEHEVLSVTAGKRVSITFNLYYADMDTESIEAAAAPVIPGKQETFKQAFEAVLANDELFPDGVALGFPLQHAYPVSTDDQSLSHIPRLLKGPDATVYSACQALGFEPMIYMRYTTTRMYRDDNQYFLVERPLNLSEEEVDDEYGGILGIVRAQNGIVAQNPGAYDESDRSDEDVYWVSEPTTHLLEKQAYMAYGNQSMMKYAYRDLYLVVRIGKAGSRMEYRTSEEVREAIMRKMGGADRSMERGEGTESE